MAKIEEVRKRERAKRWPPQGYKTCAKIRVVGPKKSSTGGLVYLGYDSNGEEVNGKVGSVLSVPKDLARLSANKLIESGLAAPYGSGEKYKEARTLASKPEPIDKIKVIGGRTSGTFHLCVDPEGNRIRASIGDVFSVLDDQITEEVAAALINKRIAERCK